jgi:hypothetical protein
MAKLSAAQINDLPDSAFLYIEPGGEKDDEGKTVPRSLRHFPVPDIEHVRNALARIPQSDLPADVKARATAKARAMLERMGGSAGKSDDEPFEFEIPEGAAWKSGLPVSFELDSAKEGDVLVAFAKADGATIDKDGHITDLSAIPSKAVPMSAYGHTSWPEKGSRLPVGRLDIGPDSASKTAMAQGSFFLKTTHGRDTYETVKGLGELGEWSYGYKILAAERAGGKTAKGKPIVRLKGLDIFEVSPTLVGAGVTRTVGIKSDDDGPLAGLPFAEDFDRVLVDVEGIVVRSKSLRDLRAKDGRELSESNRSRLIRLRESIAALEETKLELEELLARTDRADPEEAKALGAQLLAEHERVLAQLHGVAVGLG